MVNPLKIFYACFLTWRNWNNRWFFDCLCSDRLCGHLVLEGCEYQHNSLALGEPTVAFETPWLNPYDLPWFSPDFSHYTSYYER